MSLLLTALITFIGAPPPWPNYLLKTPLPNTITLRISTSTHEFWGKHKYSVHSTTAKSGNPSWALSVPVHCCWMCQECKVLNTLYPGDFSGLCLHWATMKNELLKLSGNEKCYSKSSKFPNQNPSVVMPHTRWVGILLAHLSHHPLSSLWDLGDTRNKYKWTWSSGYCFFCDW